MKKSHSILTVCGFACACFCGAALSGVDAYSSTPAQASFTEYILFQSGVGPYAQYRIPSIVETKKGSLLAFAEGRVQPSDTGDINVLLRKSRDGGNTWSPPVVVADREADTIGNPTAVVDRVTGTVWLALTGNPGMLNEDQILAKHPAGTRTVWLTRSDDDGDTWAPLTEITSQVKRPEWTWFATGPGIGIQLKDDTIVIPANYAVTANIQTWGTAVLVSQDHGKTWQVRGTIGPGTNESQMAELADGRLILNMRNYVVKGHRAISVSRDKGATWSAIIADQNLIEPVCQASIFRMSGTSGGWLLFTNPANLGRQMETIQMSRDDGQTWPFRRIIYGGPSGYSCLTQIGASQVGVVYERGFKVSYEQIAFAKFDLMWASSGAVH